MFFKIIFFLLLVDSVGANFLAWTCFGKKYRKLLPTMAKYFPLARGWAAWYLVLVLFIGYLIFVA